jgi:copper chaperone CopZ
MFRSLVLVAGLFVATPALACGGGAACDKSHCNMSANTDVTEALAAVDAAAGDKLALEVTGMKCGSCSGKITAALKALEGVNAAAVSHTTGEARIAFDASKVDADKLIAAIKQLGFEAKVPEKA